MEIAEILLNLNKFKYPETVHKNLFLSMILALLCPVAFGQTDSLNHVLSGAVYEAETGKPLSGVRVSLPGSHFATVTNEDGAFTIKSNFQPSSLVLILIGYKTVTRPVTYGRAEPLDIPMSRDSLSDQAEYYFDPDFWKAYNIIGPTTSLEHAIGRPKK